MPGHGLPARPNISTGPSPPSARPFLFLTETVRPRAAARRLCAAPAQTRAKRGQLVSEKIRSNSVKDGTALIR